MFDGNHRSRRNQNLGDSNPRRRGRTSTRQPATATRNSVGSLPGFSTGGGDGRTTLLEETRLLREERRRNLLRERSCLKIQQVYRGWHGRRRVVRTILEPQWETRQAATLVTEEALAQERMLLSLRLSQPLLAVTRRSSGARNPTTHGSSSSSWIEQALVEHAAHIDHHKNQPQQCTDDVPMKESRSFAYGLSHRIVQATLALLRPLQQPTTANLPAYVCILEYYLGTAAASNSQPDPARTFLRQRLGGSTGLLLLLQSTKECLWWHYGSTSSSATSHAEPPSFTTCLWQWSSLACSQLDNPSQKQAGQALLAAILFGVRVGFLQQNNHPLFQNTDNNSYPQLFRELVHVVTTSPAVESTTATDREFRSALAKTLHGRLHIVLSNALQQSSIGQNPSVPSTALLKLLHHILTHQPDLALLTALVVKGEDIRSLVLLREAGLGGNDEDDVDEDELAEDDGVVDVPAENAGAPLAIDSTTAEATTNISKKYKASSVPTSTRLTKQELQTMPKLERLYQDEMQRQRRETLAMLEQKKDAAYQQSLVDLALQLGQPTVWIQWGHALLSNTASPDEQSARNAYLQLLAILLQCSTGMRPRTSAGSPVLTQIAFHGSGALVEQLWQTSLELMEYGGDCQDVVTCNALTVFCDVFAHHLIALSDDKFLEHYTVTSMDGTAPALMAEQVISRIKNLLHEVYWTKPVVAADVELAATPGGLLQDPLRVIRGRFLLSGTKLWCSLYERWCRLVRSTPFCEEATWWFPHLATQEGDGAVVSGPAAQSTRRQQAIEDDGVEDMDIDDSDDEEDDDDEHHGRNQGSNAESPADARQQQIMAADAESDALASTFRDPKMARVLTCIPQALPFDRRVRLFDSLLVADKMRTQDDSEMRMAMLMMMRGENPDAGGRERVEIRRDNLYSDSMRQLNQLGTRLKKKVQVAFINQHGTQEAGIDGGGVFKEFVDDLIKDAFSFERSNDGSPHLFSVTPLQTLTVNSELTQDVSMLTHYEFLGRVLGKAVYEQILVEPQFCLPFLQQLLGKRNSLEDLKNFDMTYYKNLTSLLSLPESEIENLGLSFDLDIGKGPSSRHVELVPGGGTKTVTKQNVIQYVHLVAHQRLNVEGSAQTRAFLRGFRDLIPAAWVRLFSAYELQKLISGDDSVRGIDVASLKRSMKYAAGYHPSQQIMQWFWEILDEFSPEQQRKFLKFMTSCSRQPLLGFNSLDPPPCVQQIRLADHLFENADTATILKNAPLPTSSTCMNLLKLPNYRSKEVLRKKLLDAVESGAGFELT